MNDSISRQAAIEAICKACSMETDYHKCDGYPEDSTWCEYHVALKDLPSVQEPHWIPVKMRPMDSEEREYWEDQFGEKLEDEDAVMFDCPMPDDGQEILVSYRKWISMDKCEIDGGCYGLEGNGDWEDVIAWMPQPEPYKERTDE